MMIRGGTLAKVPADGASYGGVPADVAVYENRYFALICPLWLPQKLCHYFLKSGVNYKRPALPVDALFLMAHRY